MAWTFNKTTPVYLQIVERIRNDILSGVYPPDGEIPPVRQLALVAAVNPNTMQRAMAELEAQGLICTRSTQGRCVTNDRAIIENERERVARALVAEVLQTAKHLSISREELLKLIEEGTEL